MPDTGRTHGIGHRKRNSYGLRPNRTDISCHTNPKKSSLKFRQPLSSGVQTATLPPSFFLTQSMDDPEQMHTVPHKLPENPQRFSGSFCCPPSAARDGGNHTSRKAQWT